MDRSLLWILSNRSRAETFPKRLLVSLKTAKGTPSLKATFFNAAQAIIS